MSIFAGFTEKSNRKNSKIQKYIIGGVNERKREHNQSS